MSTTRQSDGVVYRPGERPTVYREQAASPPCRRCGRSTADVPRVLEHIERGKVIWAEHEACRQQTPSRDWLAPGRLP